MVKNILKLAAALLLLLPAAASAQVFNQSQVIISPYGGNGFLVSTTSGVSGKLQATTTPFFANFSFGNATGTLFALPSITSKVLKTNSIGQVVAAANGTDYSLITAITCSAGQFFQQVTAAGVFTCGTPTGGGGGSGNVATSTSETAGQLAYWTSTGATPATLGKVATTTPTLSANFAYTGTFGSLVGGVAGTLSITGLTTTQFSSANISQWTNNSNYITLASLSGVTPIIYNNSTGAFTWVGLATTSQPASSNLLTSNGAAGVYGTATSTLTPSAPFTGSFTQVGSGGSLGCTNASAGVTGCLTGTDWSTFNGKQAAGNYITALTGDVVASGPGSVAATLATVNGNVGTFTYSTVTADAKGRITAISNGTAPTTYTGTYPIIVTGSVISSGLSTTSNNGMAAGNLYVGSGGIFQTSASSSIFGFIPVNPTRQILTTYPLQGGGDLSADRTLTSAFGTTTTWGAGNNGFVITGATGIPFTAASSTLHLPTSALASANVSQFTNDSGYDTFAYPFIANATTSVITFGGIVITGKADGCATFASGVLNSTGSACGGSGSSPGGANGNVQFNNSTAFGGASDFFFNSVNGFASIGGSSTPQLALFSVAASSTGAVNTTIFAVASSSSGTATTTLFSVTPPSGTSDILDVQTLGGVNVFSVSSIGSSTLGLFGLCNGSNALNTDSLGNIICGAVSGTGGASFPFTPGSFGASAANSTSTILVDYPGFVAATSTFGALTASSSITNQSVKSALVLNGSGGLEGAYGGASACATNNWVTTISATGGTTCGTIGTGGVSDAMLASTFVKTLTVSTANGISGSFTAGATPVLSLTLGALTGVTSLNGLVVTANTGVITTGTWNGTAIAIANGGTGAALTGANEVPFINAANTTMAVQSNFKYINNNGLMIGSVANSGSLFGTSTLLQMSTSTNTFAQMVLQNTSNAGDASTDLVVSNDKGTNTTYYGDFGINSSGYNNPQYAGENPGDVFLQSSDSGLNMEIASTSSTATPFNFNVFVGGTLAAMKRFIVSIASTTANTTFGIATTSTQAFTINDSLGTNDLLFNTASTTGSIFTVAATTSPSLFAPIKLFDVDQYGHLTASSTGATPTISCTPTNNPTIGANSNDVTGDVTTGTLSTACTVTFAHAYAATPEIMVTGGSTASIVGVTSRSTTAFTIGLGTAATGDDISYFVVMP